jgi:hypothetical protein
MSRHIEKLNQILRRELGANPYSQGVFAWKWSTDLFWPSTETGRMIMKKIRVPIIGGGGDTDFGEILVKEFKPRRMTLRHPDCWIVTRWLPPAALVGLRLDIKIGSEPDEIDIPREMILDRWRTMFPGADYPERGWYVTTDYYCKPHQEPTFDDNQFLIAQLREQMSGLSAQSLYLDMLNADDARNAKTTSTVEDACENEFTAFLNPFPGRRGGPVSFGGVDEKQLISKP